MKVCVVGAGAIGGFIGARLASAGHEVSLVARGAHVEALRARGVTLVSGGRRDTFPVAATDRPEDLGRQDVVFVGLKAYSIPAMLPRMAPLVGPETTVVPAINGLPWWYFYREGGPFDGSPITCLDPDGSLFQALDPRHIIGCVVHASAEVTEPGVITQAGKTLIVGEPDGSSSERLGRLATALSGAGFDVTVSPRIRGDVWAKLIGNLSYNPVAALTLARMGEIHANPRLLELIRALMTEAKAVSAAYGVEIALSPDERIDVARKLGNVKISMHQDVERGRPLEVDAIVGAVTELARRTGVPTPMIDAVHALVGERARHLGDTSA
ncbi:MAG: 2-dehydropantoate 2-reductase [Deltaproteobacteria bacterium]|nr:2-dehydropantoate 2-reductase [Deltaproteobacteria bacterium]